MVRNVRCWVESRHLALLCIKSSKAAFLGFWQDMNWWLLLGAILADHIITEMGIRRHGVDIEGNPFFHWSWRRFGGVGSLLLQTVLLCPLLWLAERLAPTEAILLPLTIWLTVGVNIILLLRQGRRS